MLNNSFHNIMIKPISNEFLRVVNIYNYTENFILFNTSMTDISYESNISTNDIDLY